MDKIIITVVGKDTLGIIARVTTYLYQNNILDDMFNMMVIADMQNCKKEFGLVSDELQALGVEIGLRVLTQKEEIFTKMHRI